MTSMILHSGELMPALSMNEVTERRNAVVEFTRAAMKEGIDYGVIPGTNTKPTLLKPGAEKLCTLFGLSPSFETTETIKDWTGAEHGGEPLFYFEIKCKLYRMGVLIAEGDGLCHSWEKKYRFREAKRLCPDCGQPTIIKGKKEFGGGWLCFKKQGGCGAKFFDGDADIERQEIGQVSNPDMPDLINTIKKMAVKRALIAAVLLAVNASEFFTQDMDDQIIEGHYTVEDAPPPPVVVQPEPAAPSIADRRARTINAIKNLWVQEEASGGDLTIQKAERDLGDLSDYTNEGLGRLYRTVKARVDALPVQQHELQAA